MFDDRNQPYMKSRDIEITSAQLLAMQTTVVELLEAPGVGKAYILTGVMSRKPAGTAYAAIDVADDIVLKYTGTSGEDLIHIETTGFLDQTTEELRYAYPSQLSTNAAAGIFAIEPVENANVVAHINNGAITTGNTSLFLRVYYMIVPTTLGE